MPGDTAGYHRGEGDGEGHVVGEALSTPQCRTDPGPDATVPRRRKPAPLPGGNETRLDHQRWLRHGHTNHCSEDLSYFFHFCHGYFQL